MPEQLYPWMHLLGRILFALFFVASGLSHLFRVNEVSARAQQKSVPAPRAAAAITGLIMVVGGVFVATGWHRFIGAGLLVIYLVPTAFVMHPFWKATDPATRSSEASHFLKSLALAGAALLVAYWSGGNSVPWPMSLR